MKIRLAPNQSLGHTYIRFNWEAQKKEYLSYAGGNESYATFDSRYNRDCYESKTFGVDKPCLCLERVYSMHPWAIIDNVMIPKSGPCGISVYFFHK